MNTSLKLLIASICLSLSGFVLAQIPETQHSDGISYITGGVGEGETSSILAEAKQWPLMLEMSQIENGRGVWIFGAKIKIVDSQKRTIFDAQADGPYMLINLEPGDYQIQATYQDVEQKRVVTVKENSTQKISLFWK